MNASLNIDCEAFCLLQLGLEVKLNQVLRLEKKIWPGK